MARPPISGEDEELRLPNEGDENHGQEDDVEDAASSEDADEDGEEGDDGDDESEGQGEGSEEVKRKPSRYERRVETLRKENARLREEQVAHQKRVDDELKQLRQERMAPRLSPEEEAVRERELLAVMTPEERLDYRLEQSEKRNAGVLRQMAMSQADALDKANFQGKAAVDPRYKRYEAEVETELASLRAQGQNVSRDSLLAYVIGKKVLGQPAKAAEAQRAAGKQRIAAGTTKSLNGRGDVGAQRGKQTSLAKRLENVRI